MERFIKKERNQIGEFVTPFSLASLTPKKRLVEVIDDSGGGVKTRHIVLPDSYIKPYKIEEGGSETISAKEGFFVVFFFDQDGEIKEKINAFPGKKIKISGNTWHTFVAEAPFVFEAQSEGQKVTAPWSPGEGTKEGQEYLERLKKETQRATVDKSRIK